MATTANQLYHIQVAYEDTLNIFFILWGVRYIYTILQDDEEEDVGAESELDESESEADVGAEDEKQSAQNQEKNNAKPAAPQKYVALPIIAPEEMKGYQKTKARYTEEVLRLCWCVTHLLLLLLPWISLCGLFLH